MSQCSSDLKLLKIDLKLKSSSSSSLPLLYNPRSPKKSTFSGHRHLHLSVPRRHESSALHLCLHRLEKLLSLALILQCLSIQGLTSSGGGSGVSADGGNSSGVSRALVKERFRIFNVQFEELHQKQSQWTVPDTELRESLRLAVAEVLLPAYRSLFKRFGPLVESGKNPQKYIRYTAEDLERMLGEFFEGKTLNEPRRS